MFVDDRRTTIIFGGYQCLSQYTHGMSMLSCYSHAISRFSPLVLASLRRSPARTPPVGARPGHAAIRQGFERMVTIYGTQSQYIMIMYVHTYKYLHIALYNHVYIYNIGRWYVLHIYMCIYVIIYTHTYCTILGTVCTCNRICTYTPPWAWFW